MASYPFKIIFYLVGLFLCLAVAAVIENWHVNRRRHTSPQDEEIELTTLVSLTGLV